MEFLVANGEEIALKTPYPKSAQFWCIRRLFKWAMKDHDGDNQTLKQKNTRINDLNVVLAILKEDVINNTWLIHLLNLKNDGIIDENKLKEMLKKSFMHNSSHG